LSFFGIIFFCLLVIRVPVYGLDPGLLPPKDVIQITLPTSTPTPTVKFMLPDKTIRISIVPLTSATPTQTITPSVTVSTTLSPTPDQSTGASAGAYIGTTETPARQEPTTQGVAAKNNLNQRDMVFFGIIGFLAFIILVILFLPKRKKESDSFTEEQK